MGACYHVRVSCRLLLICLCACRVTAEDLETVPSVPEGNLEAPPPPTEGEDEERLFQLLYAGESGDAAFEAGQRARVRAWLGTMAFRAEDLALLRRVVERVAEVRAVAEAEEQALAARELAELGPVYAAIEASYRQASPPSAAELAAHAEALSAARVRAYGTETPAALRQARVRRLLDEVAPFVDQLPAEQRTRLASARFFLVRRASPFGRTGAYHALVGLDWDAGEAAQLSSTEAAPEQPQMDIGGLWAVEKLRAPPGRYLTARQAQAIVVMAALEPALAEALAPVAPSEPTAPPAP